MLKKLFIFILLCALIVSICLACAAYFLKPFLKEKVLEAAKKGLGKEIELSEFDISLLRGIIFLKGFRIEDSKLIKYHNVTTADEIILDIDLLSTFLRKRLIFQKICLKNFAFNLKNRKRPPPLMETTLPTFEGPETKIASPDEKRIPGALYIKRLLIKNSQVFFTDYSVKPSPTVIKVMNINGKIEDLSVPLLEGGVLKGIAHLNGQLNSKNEGLFQLDGSFIKSEKGVNFDFELKLNNMNLTRLSPYYSNTSFAILKEAKLDLHSEASCQRNQINAFQNARIYGIELYDIAPGGEETLFGLPAKTVIEFFKDLKGDIKFSFNIVGTIDDPRFDPGPVIRQVLSSAMRDKIISKLQELPREVIEMSEKVLDENLGLREKLKILDEDKIKEKIKDIKKKLKKIID